MIFSLNRYNRSGCMITLPPEEVDVYFDLYYMTEEEIWDLIAEYGSR